MSHDGSVPPGTVKKKRFPAQLNLSSTVVTTKRPWDAAVTDKNKVQSRTVTEKNLDAHASKSMSFKSQSKSISAANTGDAIPGNMDALRLRMAQRLYAGGIRHEGVLRAMSLVPRHLFVDTAFINQAYEDTSLPIGLGQTISKPSIVARMIELLMPGEGLKLGRVLEIGGGGGYQAAVLAALVGEVYSIERLKGLHERSRVNLRPLRLKNVHLIYGDGIQGFPSGAPYDAIIAAAGGEDIPIAWLEQLSVGGVLIAPVSSNRSGAQTLVKVERTLTGWQQYTLEAVQFVPLVSGVL